MFHTPVRAVRQTRGPHRFQPAGELLNDAVAAARAGSEHAFTTLFHEFQPRLLRYLRPRCGDAAQDVAAETWACVVADLHRFRGNADDFAAWLFTIARYRGIDFARAAARRPLPLPEDYDPDSGLDVEQTLMENIEATEVLQLLTALPPDQAEAVALRVLAGLDVPTVAQLLGKSDNAIRICTHRGLRRLEATLASRAEVVA